jgi:hypothetical protein
LLSKLVGDKVLVQPAVMDLEAEEISPLDETTRGLYCQGEGQMVVAGMESSQVSGDAWVVGALLKRAGHRAAYSLEEEAVVLSWLGSRSQVAQQLPLAWPFLGVAGEEHEQERLGEILSQSQVV